MSIVINDSDLRLQLAEVSQAELCDVSGNSIGHFVSRDLFYRLLMAMPDAQVTEEELNRAFQEPGGCTLPEIWARLGAS